MAINISNLVVRLHVNESNSATDKDTGSKEQVFDAISKEEVVKETLKEVIRILKENEER